MRRRRFEEVRLCTGSTDANGAFLLWLHRTFGVKRAIVYLNPAFASFDLDRLAALPFDVRFVTPKTLRACTRNSIGSRVPVATPR
jgi:hypothetical protein